MKKTLIVSALAFAALGGTGAALADAECQAGSAYGYKPGCGGPSDAYGDIPDPRFVRPGVPNHSGYYPWVLSDGGRILPHVVVPQHVGPRYAPSRRDRDGDGVANANDRWPRDSGRW